MFPPLSVLGVVCLGFCPQCGHPARRVEPSAAENARIFSYPRGGYCLDDDGLDLFTNVRGPLVIALSSPQANNYAAQVRFVFHTRVNVLYLSILVLER